MTLSRHLMKYADLLFSVLIQAGICQVSYKCLLIVEHFDIQQFSFFALPIDFTQPKFNTQN